MIEWARYWLTMPRTLSSTPECVWDFSNKNGIHCKHVNTFHADAFQSCSSSEFIFIIVVGIITVRDYIPVVIASIKCHHIFACFLLLTIEHHHVHKCEVIRFGETYGMRFIASPISMDELEDTCSRMLGIVIESEKKSRLSLCQPRVLNVMAVVHRSHFIQWRDRHRVILARAVFYWTDLLTLFRPGWNISRQLSFSPGVGSSLHVVPHPISFSSVIILGILFWSILRKCPNIEFGGLIVHLFVWHVFGPE